MQGVYLSWTDRRQLSPCKKNSEGKLIILDQHAVHEKILYERYSDKRFRATQKLLSKIEIDIPKDRDIGFVMELKEIGFDFDIIDGKIFIFEVPAYLSSLEAEEVILEYVNSGRDGIDDLIKMVACKKAIKANTRLEVWEAKELIKQWLDCRDRDFCPHGRPASMVLSRKELDRMFKR